MTCFNNRVFLVGMASLALTLAGCGGGSDGSSTTTNDTGTTAAEMTGSETVENQSPVAAAGVDITAFEQRSVTLNATRSSDAEGSSLSYLWRQLSGPAVTISNEYSATPTLQLPKVATASEVLMELEVSDGVSASSLDKMKIRVLEQPSENIISLLPQRSVIMADGAPIEVAFDLNVSEGGSGAGLVVNLHWDSKRLAFKTLGDRLEEKHLGASEPFQDDNDLDNNPSTDQYITLSWIDFEAAQWLSGATFPLKLFAASFEPVVGATGSTQVNISPQFIDTKHNIATQTVSVEL